jgi:multidrug resistance efflux pump
MHAADSRGGAAMHWKPMVVAGVLLSGVVAALGFAWPFGKRDEVLKLPGIVEIHEVRLGPRVGGRVKEVLVTEGDPVKAGQPLVVLDVPDLQAQRKVLEAKVAEARAEHEKALAGPRPQEKDMARAAVAVARAKLVKLEKGFRDEEKRQARSELDAAKADEQLAVEEYRRERRVRSVAAGTPANFDNAQANLDRARGRVAAAKARWEMLEAGSRTEDIVEARAEVARLEANEKLLLLGTRQEEIDSAYARLREAEGRLEELQVNLDEATVRAAEPCVVEIVNVRKGDLAVAGQPVVKVLRNADLWVKTYVPETELGKVRLGQEVQVTMDSFPGVRFAGRVVHIGAESEFTPRNVQTVDERRHQMFGVRVKIDDPQGRYKSGMAAEVSIPTNEPRTNEPRTNEPRTK